MSGVRRDGPVLLCYDGSPSSASAIAVAGRLLAARNSLVCHTWVGLLTAMRVVAIGRIAATRGRLGLSGDAPAPDASRRHALGVLQTGSRSG